MPSDQIVDPSLETLIIRSKEQFLEIKELMKFPVRNRQQIVELRLESDRLAEEIRLYRLKKTGVQAAQA